jgi:hypothetical protein
MAEIGLVQFARAAGGKRAYLPSQRVELTRASSRPHTFVTIGLSLPPRDCYDLDPAAL